MPRYFFKVVGADVDPGSDPDGIELENFDAARTEAVKLAGALTAESPDLLINGPGLRVEMTDEGGFAKFTVIAIGVLSTAPISNSRSPVG